MAGVAAVLAALLVGALALGSAVLASHRARAAADLAALAGAGALLRGSSTLEACAVAGALARRNTGLLRDCRAAGDGSLVVSVGVSSALPGLGAAVARARAGPAEPAGAPASGFDHTSP